MGREMESFGRQSGDDGVDKKEKYIHITRVKTFHIGRPMRDMQSTTYYWQYICTSKKQMLEFCLQTTGKTAVLTRQRPAPVLSAECQLIGARLIKVKK